MPAEILPVGNTAVDSADLVVEAGSPVTVALKGAEGGAVVRIELKDDAGGYHGIGALDASANETAVVIAAPGTYRFHRAAGAACGVFSA